MFYDANENQEEYLEYLKRNVDIFRGFPNTVDIFTDASTTNVTTDGPAGLGFIALHNGMQISKKIVVLSNRSSGLAEATAIKLAVIEALNIRRSGFTGSINIFSDSLNCVNSLRWYFSGWVMEDGVIYGTEKDISAQKEYNEIFRIVVENKLYVNFFYTPGHCVIGKWGKKNKDNYRQNLSNMISFVKDQFIKKNKLSSEAAKLVNNDFAKYLCEGNAQIDFETRWYLYREIDAINRFYMQPFYFTIPDDQFNYYKTEVKNYVNKKGELINYVQ